MPLSVVGIFSGPGVGIADDDTLITINHCLMEYGRVLWQGKHPVPHRFALLLDASCKNELVASCLKQVNILAREQSGIGHHDEIGQSEAAHEVINEWYHRASLVLRAVEYGVSERVTVHAHQQAEDNLGLGGFAVLGEARHQQGVLACSLEVQRSDIIEHDADLAAKDLARVLHTDLLNPLAERLVQLVHETVDDVDVHLSAPIPAQVIGSRQLAPGAADTGHHQVAEHLAA